MAHQAPPVPLPPQGQIYEAPPPIDRPGVEFPVYYLLAAVAIALVALFLLGWGLGWW